MDQTARMIGIFPNELIRYIYDQCDVIARAKLATTCQYFKNLWKKQDKVGTTYMLKFKTLIQYNNKQIISQQIILNQSIVRYDQINDKEFGEKWILHEKKLYSRNSPKQTKELMKYFEIENYFSNKKYSNGYNRINIEIHYAPCTDQPEIQCTRPVSRHIKTIQRPSYF